MCNESERNEAAAVEDRCLGALSPQAAAQQASTGKLPPSNLPPQTLNPEQVLPRPLKWAHHALHGVLDCQWQQLPEAPAVDVRPPAHSAARGAYVEAGQPLQWCKQQCEALREETAHAGAIHMHRLAWPHRI